MVSTFSKRYLAIGINNHDNSDMNLRPCINDASDVSRSLQSIGFRGFFIRDASIDKARRTVDAFVQSVTPGSVAIFYFSGHGFQHRGKNYLVTSTTEEMNPSNLDSTAINAEDVIERAHQRKPRLVICILDCCRSEYERDSAALGRRPTGISRKFSDGLAPMQGPPGTLIAFACAAGDTASANSLNKRNSLYTSHLLRYLINPTMDIENLLKYVGAAVEKESKNAQIPYRYSSCNEFIYLAGGYARKGFAKSKHPSSSLNEFLH
jgi:uncharacterized caspase-like protein